MDRITLYEELRLIERSESEVNNAWKGAHLLLFFLAFVFGSFCTFCFHMLMYMFDEKCVLFPKILTLNSLRHNIIYEFIPDDKEKSDPLPVDFLSTQFVHKTACYLPTYVPLVSGIFGLVWTTIFLMCSSSSRSLSGLQRPWRVILPVLVFSIAMSILCIYSSAITHFGLQDLCLKLGNITGSTTCSYTVNVATLAYERQIRGVYQATRLAITSAWMHTACWVASAILAIVRILLAVDFRLVKIRAELIGDMDRMLEINEEHLKTVLPSRWPNDGDSNTSANSQFYYKIDQYDNVEEYGQLMDVGSDILFMSEEPVPQSDLALLSEERNKSARINAYESVLREHRFIVNWLYDILDSLEFVVSSSSSSSGTATASSTETIARQFGQQILSSKIQNAGHSLPTLRRSDSTEAEELYKQIKKQLQRKVEKRLVELRLQSSDEAGPSSSMSKKADSKYFESLANITPEMQKSLKGKSKTSHSSRKSEKPMVPRSSLKSDVVDAGMQTDKKKKSKKKQKVTIATDILSEKGSSSDSKKDENTQTNPKEKTD